MGSYITNNDVSSKPIKVGLIIEHKTKLAYRPTLTGCTICNINWSPASTKKSLALRSVGRNGLLICAETSVAQRLSRDLEIS